MQEILDGVRPEQAAQHPQKNAHSIWELVLHAAAWAEAARTSLQSGETGLSDEENFPAVRATDPLAWEQAQARLEAAHKDLAEAVRGLKDADLTKEVVGLHGSYSLYVLFHGVVQHSLYHGEQMILLKKAANG